MSKKNLKALLETYDKKQLIGLVTELYDKNKSVKEYLDYYVSPDEDKALEKYKKQVMEAFYPSRGFRLRLSLGKKAISEFRQLKPDRASLIDLLLFYVETGVQFTNEYGDIDEPFYSSLESTYRSALKLINTPTIGEMFQDRAFEIVKRTRNIGWGFHDALADNCYEIYGESMNTIQYEERGKKSMMRGPKYIQ